MLFGKTKGDAAPAKRQGRDEFNGMLGSGSNYEGCLKFEGMVRMDCTFKGEIESTGTLVLGPGAEVDGHIKVGILISSGTIKGRVDAARQATLNKSSVLEGELHSPALAVEEGAMLVGRIVMGDTAASKTPAPKELPTSQKDTEQSLDTKTDGKAAAEKVEPATSEPSTGPRKNEP